MNLSRRLFPGLYRASNKLKAEIQKLRAQRDTARLQRDRARQRIELLKEKLQRVQNSWYELWCERYGADYNLTLPPEEVQRHIGATGPVVLMGGIDITQQTAKLLEDHAGRTLDSFEAILDFGCGSGRVTRFLKRATSSGRERESSTRLYGCDIDRQAIEWCSANLSDVAQFAVSNPEPPAPYGDGSFDFIFVFSVFTHLPEAMQFAWLADLKRMLRPGGLLLATFHGSTYWNRLPAEQKSQLEKLGFIYFDRGKTKGLPDFYLTTYHSHDYIRKRWSEYFEILSIIPHGLQTHDVALCRAGKTGVTS